MAKVMIKKFISWFKEKPKPIKLIKYRLVEEIDDTEKSVYFTERYNSYYGWIFVVGSLSLDKEEAEEKYSKILLHRTSKLPPRVLQENTINEDRRSENE